MNAIFMIFHDLKKFNGISKKIIYQVKALNDCGIDTQISYMKEEGDYKQRMINENPIRQYGNTFKGKILKRIDFDSILDYIRKEKIEFIYIRYDHNANPFTIRFMRKLKKEKIKIALEIPTYPYDQEYKGLPLPYQRILFIDKLFRKQFVKYADKIVTFSDDEMIWDRPTIRISNGIDFNEIKLKEKVNDTSEELHLIGVATIHPWHGFDRAIKGLIEYYKNHPELKVYFHIVGFGVPEVVEDYKEMVRNSQLEDSIIFHSALFGKELDDIFEISDIGIGSLARHRSHIDKIKTLKNREYAARGIPFVYSETDDDFECMPYILKVPADETPLDINKLIQFYKSIDIPPQSIRASIEKSLSWKVQMKKVVDNLLNK